ncbi:Capsular glucan synthase [Rubripirellula tenax]|uniref:Capsular glucan synthase n=1 Tax=Rubripirellula tenax TaxID=2528015 RepID=A0A5C6FJE0_9BACT|nr:glycosyltransferase [Rubripirellula tenax]TWU60169.1 Capsular glucan synthase [Rubripirellula tenax]
MKVLQVVADGVPGGGTTNVLALTEDLLGRSVDVAFCSQRDSYAIEQATALGAQVCDGLDFFSGRLNRRIVRELSAVVEQVNPDIVHVHGGRAAFAWTRGGNQARFPTSLYTVRGYHFYTKPAPLRFLGKRAERHISRSVYKTVHVCEKDREVGLQLGFVPDPSRSTVIRNGLRLSDIPQYDGLRDPKNVAVLGRVTHQKYPELILELAAMLADDGFVFHMIGGGDMEDEIRAQVARENLTNVRMYGHQSRDDGLKIMSETGTFLLASRYEGLPIAPVEAMAMGLPVVICDVNGCPEVVRDGIDGRVVPMGDRQGFAAALRAVISEPDKTAQMIESGKTRVVEHFTRDRVVQQHLELYEQCLNDRGVAVR